MRLLLVEDSLRLQRSIALGLRKSGYVVDVVGDGENAVWQAQSVDYDVIVLDVMIPVLDGMGVLKSLRDQGRSTHVLLLTAKDTVEDRVKGLQAGADDYLIKPFAFEELLARVQALCRRNYVQKSPQVTIGEFTINFNSRQVTLSGQPINLLPREFRLLEYLLMRRGEVVSRTEVEAHLYDNEKEIMSNAVDSTVSQLRKKISLSSPNSLIQTKRGMGYYIAMENE